MARKAKIDNSILKRFYKDTEVRQEETRSKKLYFLVVCEGTKTEPNYFEGIKKDIPKGKLHSISLEVEGTGKNTLSIIKETIKISKKIQKEKSIVFDEIWVVFDKDSFPDVNFNNAIAKAKSQKNMWCAWSNQAFELWYLLHFQFVNTALERDVYKAYLQREIKRVSNMEFKYEKNRPDMYDILKKYGNQSQAIKWAEKLIEQYQNEDYASQNPCTHVHELVDKLINKNC